MKAMILKVGLVVAIFLAVVSFNISLLWQRPAEADNPNGCASGLSKSDRKALAFLEDLMRQGEDEDQTSTSEGDQ